MMNSKRAAMEMSVGTIVTIVLLMSVLILGIFLVQKIFRTASSAIDTIDNEVQNEISKLFSEEGKSLAIYPTSQAISLKKGADPKGFAFSVKNKNTKRVDYTYIVEADDISKCGTSMTKSKAESFLLGGSGSFSLEAGNPLGLPRLVKFDIPETAPPCTLTYNLEISGEDYSEGAQIFVTIK